jgi:hypothetical protein
MVLNKSKLIPFKNETAQVNFIKHNLPGLYFLYDQDYKLIYIGESMYPLCRITDHYYKAYANKERAKGVGPVFTYFRILRVEDKDFRIRQHYEKRWIKKYNPPLNNNRESAPYELSCKDIKSFILVYDGFFKNEMPWYRYINDEVLKKQPNYINYRREKRIIRERKRRGYA